MKLVYKDSNNYDLGSITFDGISETLIPDFTAHSHETFLTSVFNSQPTVKNWHVDNLSLTDTEAVFTLGAQSKSSSLGLYMQSQSHSSAKKYIRRFDIVEVDFGFFSQVFQCNDLLLHKNLTYSSALLPGELHKKRPCIVIDVEDSRAQVIPLSTSDSAGHDKNNIQISPESFNNFADRYTQKPTFALVKMIQTVSIYRIYPPKSDDGKSEHKYSRFKLSNADRQQLNSTLANQYHKDIVSKLNLNEKTIESQKQERAKLLDRIKSADTKTEEALARCSLLESDLILIAKSFNIEGDIEYIREQLKQVI